LLVSNDSTEEPKAAGAIKPTAGRTATKGARPRGFVLPYAGPNGGGAAATLQF
jgi:hypothetical protein